MLLAALARVVRVARVTEGETEALVMARAGKRVDPFRKGGKDCRDCILLTLFRL